MSPKRILWLIRLVGWFLVLAALDLDLLHELLFVVGLAILLVCTESVSVEPGGA